MFMPTRACWSAFQDALGERSKLKKSKYVLKIDMANFFGSINQHTMINVLSDAGYPAPLASRLEVLLTSYTGERSSRGILQGMYPSDLFGNYYLDPLDRFFADLNIPSVRYVDDVYIFLETVDDANQLFQKLTPMLRGYDLVLNEAKAKLMLKNTLFSEEPDLEKLFNRAVKEISEQIDDEDFDADYGFQSEWEDEDNANTKENLELKATIKLFDSISSYSGQEENIERFCLPFFAKVGSNYALQHVMDSFNKRPSMSQIYAAYLAKFLDDEEIVSDCLIGLLKDPNVFDWQKMWALAALLQLDEANDSEVKIVMDLFKDANCHEALRAVAALYIGRLGDHTRRKSLVTAYSNVSDYIKAAIYFSSDSWPSVERNTAKASWGKQGVLQRLITTAINAD